MGNGVAAPVAAVVTAHHGEQDELLGILDGEEAKENLVQEGKDGGVGANAESQREDGHGGEARSASEHAEGVLEVAKDGVEPTKNGGTAWSFVGERGHRDTSGN